MQGNVNLLTPHDMAAILGISEYAIETLARLGVIPHTYVQLEGSNAQALRFNPYLITDYFRTNPTLDNITGQPHIDSLKAQYQKLFPGVLHTLKSLDAQLAPRRVGKGYSLSKVKSKRYGFLYYVRYIENGKLIPSRWNTRTNNKQIAEYFAANNREQILSDYHARQQFDNKFYDMLENYYKKDSPYLETAKQRGRSVGEKTIEGYHAFITKTFIPFLRSQNIHTANDITPPVIMKLQNKMLAKKHANHTVNRKTGCVKAIFDHMVMDDLISENPFRKTATLKLNMDKSKIRGCYEISKLKGVFNTRWQDPQAHILCLIIYSTGLRNSEIERIRLQDIVTINRLYFINVHESKTENGVRFIPLHSLVHDKLTAYAKKKKRSQDEPIFQFNKMKRSWLYGQANLELGKKLKVDKKTLKAQNITFYSGRHFWKTLMNAYELGDVEEYFMGHKVTGDVAKRYNHRDKQGQQRIINKAREVFKILDKALFKDKTRSTAGPVKYVK
jgi:site-specific recombinase XerD